MKVLVIGSGGREHALVWKVSQSPAVKKIYCAPGNAGIAKQAECVPISAEDVKSLTAWAEKERIDLTVVGPEAPLTLGIVEVFEARGLRIFGPHQKAAEIEGSKAFAKDLMKKYNIPSGDSQTFEDHEAAARYVKDKGAPLVVKADGLAAGKGVIICRTVEEGLAALDLIMVKKASARRGRKCWWKNSWKEKRHPFWPSRMERPFYPCRLPRTINPYSIMTRGRTPGGWGLIRLHRW